MSSFVKVNASDGKYVVVKSSVARHCFFVLAFVEYSRSNLDRLLQKVYFDVIDCSLL